MVFEKEDEADHSGLTFAIPGRLSLYSIVSMSCFLTCNASCFLLRKRASHSIPTLRVNSVQAHGLMSLNVAASQGSAFGERLTFT